MRREDVTDLFAKIPVREHPRVVLVLKGLASINVDTLMRQEAEYVVVRGREAGTNDEGRAFFVPYEQISYVKIEKLVRLNDIRTMYGEATVASTSLADNEADDTAAGTTTPSPAATPAPAGASVQSAAVDPAAIAKQNLLDRIRAARTSAGGPRPK